VVNPVKIIPSSSLIAIHNMFTVSHTVCGHVDGQKNLGNARAPPSYDGGVTDDLETRPYPTCVTIPNFVALDQTVSA